MIDRFDWTVLNRSQLLVKYWGEGRSASAIANLLNTTKGVVIAHTRFLKLKRRDNPQRKQREWSPPELELMKKAREDGKSWRWLGAVFGVAAATVRLKGAELGIGQAPRWRDKNGLIMGGLSIMPPGDPLSWEPLIRGTCLDGTPYPRGY